ncbi:mechanosensitive ion channel [Bacillus sp. Cr_A10]|uniref:mechanosensitive ion channel n=1 Tax=Bacillus sp. Cr_A10 TaxID=3033993 RepID=UPI0023DC6AE0|nr:mechanosensitive ion channel [Bacillus sp. Cr_A10]MDF2065923.1 mechanosensitive ion channel [Bacillus sp. Cr_A10]
MRFDDDFYWRSTLSFLPELLLALLVLLIGFFIAKFLENVTYKVLRKFHVNEKLGNTKSKWTVEKVISKVVFIIVLLLAFVLFFNILNLNSIATPFVSMYSGLTGAFLNILKAGLILLFAWVLATVVKKVIQAAGNKLNLNKYVEKTGVKAKEEDQAKWTDTAANVAYYLIFLLFIPAVLSALGIDGLSGPFEGMVASFFNFIPKLISAAIIFAIGWFVAKLVSNLIEKFLQSAGADRLAHKLKLSSFFEGTSVSKVVGIIAFVLIMIPVTISALDILDIDGISEPAVAMLNDIMAMLPKIAIAILLVLVGIVAARWVKDIVVSLLEKLGVNSIFGKMGFNSTSGAAPSFAALLGTIVQVVIILLFVVEALQLLELDFMVVLATGIFAYLPSVIAAIIILAVGFWLANLVEKLVGSLMKHASGTPHFLRYVAKYAILAFAFFMALDQLGIAASIINSAFILILGGVALAFGLAFGLGGKEHAARYLSKMERSLENAEVTKENYKVQKETMKESFKENFKGRTQAEKSLKGTRPHVDEVNPVNDSGIGKSNNTGVEPGDTGYNIPSTDDLYPYDDLPPTNDRPDTNK